MISDATRSKLLCILSLLLSFTFSFSVELRNLGFVKPMNLPFHLAGSFAEPRPDHFHSGIDIKTNGVEGEPVFAVYDGYISRIRVSPFGYGRAIYITHPNGFTSVYGHLSRFNATIEKYIHDQHYKAQKSELDISLTNATFPVKKSDTIAFSGNTGGSTAPHLHFEIRDSKTENALNALDFYPASEYADTIPPQLNKIKVYDFQDLFYASFITFKSLILKDGILTTAKPVTITHNNKFAFSLEGFDKQDTSENKNGIKKIEIYKDKQRVFQYDIDEIDFSTTRACNVFVDYNEMMEDNGYYYNCYHLKNNPLNIYSGDGFFTADKADSIQLDVYCYDYNNNSTHIHLVFLDDKSPDEVIDAKEKQRIDSLLYQVGLEKKDSIQFKDFKMIFQEKTFYDKVAIKKISLVYKDQAYKTYHDGYWNTDLIAMSKAAQVSIHSAVKKNRNKMLIARQDSKGKITALKTTYDKTKFYADTKELGTFSLQYDTLKPDISNIKVDTENQYISAIITDHLSGINTYNGYIDGKWINFYYDAKNDRIEYHFDEYCKKGEHILKLIVTDNSGNKTAVAQTFTF